MGAPRANPVCKARQMRPLQKGRTFPLDRQKPAQRARLFQDGGKKPAETSQRRAEGIFRVIACLRSLRVLE